MLWRPTRAIPTSHSCVIKGFALLERMATRAIPTSHSCVIKGFGLSERKERFLLFVVFQNLFVDVAELDASIAEHLFGFLAGMVTEFTDDVGDSAVDDQHGTGAAWGHLAIEGRSGK